MAKKNIPRTPYPYLKRTGKRTGVQGFLADLLENSERPVIGYGYGYTPWPKVAPVYYRVTLHRMKKRGLVQEAQKEGRKFVKLTRKGKLQALFGKLRGCALSSRSEWDGKWWLVIFDIPEKGKLERNQLRRILKATGFHRLQKSVYIAPQAFSSEAIQYLKQSGLFQFIRCLKVEELDDDRELKKHFQLI